MQSIREDQLKRIKRKSDFLTKIGALPPQLDGIIDGVVDLDVANAVGKEGRDQNWPKVTMIEQIFDTLLKMTKEEMTAEACENCDKCEDKIKIIDELLGESGENSLTNLENMKPLGEC